MDWMEQWMRRQWENRKYVLHTPTFHFFFPWRCATLALWMSRRLLTACWPVLVPLTDVWTELVAHPHWDLWLPVKAEEVGGERVGLPPLTFLQKQKYVQDSWKPIKQSAIHPALNPQCHSDGTFNSTLHCSTQTATLSKWRIPASSQNQQDDRWRPQ